MYEIDHLQADWRKQQPAAWLHIHIQWCPAKLSGVQSRPKKVHRYPVAATLQGAKYPAHANVHRYSAAAVVMTGGLTFSESGAVARSTVTLGSGSCDEKVHVAVKRLSRDPARIAHTCNTMPSGRDPLQVMTLFLLALSPL